MIASQVHILISNKMIGPNLSLVITMHLLHNLIYDLWLNAAL